MKIELHPERRPASELPPHPDLENFYESQQARAPFVSRLFDEAAPSYDSISSILSFGTCKWYRKQALLRAGLEPRMCLLDVATGTGLVAQAALELGVAPGRIIGLDPSRGMLDQNRKLRRISLVQGRGETLPFPDNRFDFICMGYALRHADDLGRLFREFVRVLKPGGKVLLLEITRPESRVGFALARFYVERIAALVARLLTGNRVAGRLLGYYWATIAECVPPASIMAALSGSGLLAVERHRSLGFLSDYCGAKPARTKGQ